MRFQVVRDVFFCILDIVFEDDELLPGLARSANFWGGGVVRFSGLGGGDHRNLIKRPMKIVKR